MFRNELEKSSSNSKDIQANLLKRIKILENDFKRSQAQSIDFELKLQHQNLFMACDVSWKSRLSTLNDENVDELIEHVNQKTYAYANVRSQNKDILMTISELKNKIITIDKGKNVNTKFDKSETSGTLLCVTPLPKNIAVKAKKVSITKVNAERSKPVTSHFIPKNKQSQKQSVNVIARGMYRIRKTKTQMSDSKTNMNVSNFTGVESSNSVRRPKSKDTKLKDRVLKNTNDKRSSAHVRKMSSSVSIDSNKRETMNSTMFFLLSHEKCVARYILSRDSKVRRALFTTLIAAKSKNLGATSVVTKSRLSVAKTPTATNKVSSALPLSPDSSQSRTLSNYMKNKLATSDPAPPLDFRFENDHFAAITGYGDYVQDILRLRPWLSHLNFGTINQLTSKDPVDGLLKFKYNKDHLCSACEQGKRKKPSLLPKLVPSTESKLELIHMDLCGPIRVAIINGEKYILVVVDDYSRYTWVYFLRTKYEASDVIIDFINQVQRNLKAQILKIRTDNRTEFKNEKLWLFYAKLGIVHNTQFLKRLNKIAEAIATACFTQNRSIVHTRYNKTPYELIRGRNPIIQYFHVFGSLCYQTNDRGDIGKMKPKAEIGIFIGYSESSQGFRIYNRQTKKIMERSMSSLMNSQQWLLNATI
ncbi:retrovirus-related pol polyprotein from transposon TNT 1-94 [Tanacetum coccineum]